MALKVKKEADRLLLDKRRIVSEWVNQTPATPPILNRKDSYLETLAGPFFPPDAHDFNAKQRALVMAAEANAGYDQYWKKKFMDKIISNTADEPFTWASATNLNSLGKSVKTQGFQTSAGVKDNSSIVSSHKHQSNIRQKGKIKGSPAHFALVMSRALGSGGLPPNIVFPKIRIVERPQTVYNPTVVPTVHLKKNIRPYTSVVPTAHGKRMDMLML